MNSIIGKTPLIKINYKFDGVQNYIYTKLEYYNPTGSIKDRMANYIIEKSIERGELKEGMTIVEATSGNTGIALASIGAKKGFKVQIFMPDWVSIERIKIMESFGANVKLYSKEDGGFKRCIEEAKKFAKNNNGYLVNQFSNKDNVIVHYQTTGEEIVKALHEEVGGFVSGVGTGGTLMGIGKRLKRVNPDMIVAAIEPDKMPLLSKNKAISNHKIEGIGDDFIPELIDKNEIDKVIVVNDDDAINMARLLGKKLGLGVRNIIWCKLFRSSNFKQ